MLRTLLYELKPQHLCWEFSIALRYNHDWLVVVGLLVITICTKLHIRSGVFAEVDDSDTYSLSPGDIRKPHLFGSNIDFRYNIDSETVYNRSQV